MEETKAITGRASSWAIVLVSVFLALLLTISMVQGLAAQATDDESIPTATPEEQNEDGEELGVVQDATVMLTSTVVITSSTELTATVNLTEAIPVTTTAVVSPSSSPTITLLMPVINVPLPRIWIDASRPNSQNTWQISWQDYGTSYLYRLQESKRPDFADLSLNEVMSSATKQITHGSSPFNTYYYRVRMELGGQVGEWSDTISVVGAYRDDFDDPSTGWAMRRTTFLEETAAWYGQGSNAGNFIIVVADRWDWMIASPLQAAPEPPYVVEYRARVHDASNLVSGGAVMGGDWNYDDCPEFGNVYRTDNCFNHFYNFNYIYYGPLKLQFEQVSTLYWCPNCGGSPIKRLGNPSLWKVVENIVPHSQGLNYHRYKVEVRDSGLKLWIDGSYKGQFGNGAYANDPFFGVFASTDEYKPSIWFYDWYKLTPLDN